MTCAAAVIQEGNMKTILAVLMIPAALFATWATRFVQDAVAEAETKSAGVETKAERVKAALGRKVEVLRGSFHMDTRETLSVGAALRKGQATIDRALGRPVREREDHEREKARLAREIEQERAAILALQAEEAAARSAANREAADDEKLRREIEELERQLKALEQDKE